jgi:hypothetical protein
MKPTIPTLNKSRFLAGLQCSRRLWLSWHDPAPDEQEPEPILELGRILGAKAHLLFPGGRVVNRDHQSFGEALAETQRRDPQYLLLFGSTINKVANEDYFSTRMAEDASKLRIA